MRTHKRDPVIFIDEAYREWWWIALCGVVANENKIKKTWNGVDCKNCLRSR